jgi:hypothetical protein
MPSRFDRETRANAVRLVRDHVGYYESEWPSLLVGPRTRSMQHARDRPVSSRNGFRAFGGWVTVWTGGVGCSRHGGR